MEPEPAAAAEPVDEEEAIMAASRVVARHKAALQESLAVAEGLVPTLIAEVRAESDPSSGKSMAGLREEDVKGAIACVLAWQQVLAEDQIDQLLGREPITLYTPPVALADAVVDEDGVVVPPTAAPVRPGKKGSGPILKKDLSEKVVTHSNRIRWDEDNLE